MRIPRCQPLSHILLFFLIIGILYGTGCGTFTKNIPNDLGVSRGRIVEQFVADMPIVGVEALIAASNPRQIFVWVSGDVGGSCTERHDTRQEREGNTITIRMTTVTTIQEGVGCTDEAEAYYETVYLGILPPGDYKIIVNDVARQLRIE